ADELRAPKLDHDLERVEDRRHLVGLLPRRHQPDRPRARALEAVRLDRLAERAGLVELGQGLELGLVDRRHYSAASSTRSSPASPAIISRTVRQISIFSPAGRWSTRSASARPMLSSRRSTASSNVAIEIPSPR